MSGLRRSWPLHGVGRVPLVTSAGVSVVSYDDQAKTFDYRMLGGQDVVWRRTLPMGGYAQSVWNESLNELCVPNSFTKYTALDPVDGSLRWEADLGSRIRSSAAAFGAGYLIFIGNRLVAFDSSGVSEAVVVPGAIFFGQPVVRDGFAYSLAGVRSGNEADLAIVCVDVGSRCVRWVSNVGNDYVVASDTAGLAVDAERGHLVVGNADGEVVAVQLSDGHIVWRTALSEGRTAVRSAPAVGAGHITIGTLEGSLHVLSAITGAEQAWCIADPLGIWSTPSIAASTLVVHAGAWLSERRLDDLSVVWETPIGFNAYSAPVVEGDDLIHVCGGDPPADGYLHTVDRSATTASLQYDVEYTLGDTRDFLRLTFRPEFPVDQVDMDLRHFGRSGYERLLDTGDGSVYWAGEVAPNKRYAEVVVQGNVYAGTMHHPVSWVVDTGSAQRPSVPTARVLGDTELPAPSDRHEDSGGPVVAALLAEHGRMIDPSAAEEAARYIRGRGVDPHHIWRGGAGRIFAASELPLLESRGIHADASDALRVIEKWEEVDEDTSN